MCDAEALAELDVPQRVLRNPVVDRDLFGGWRNGYGESCRRWEVARHPWRGLVEGFNSRLHRAYGEEQRVANDGAEQRHSQRPFIDRGRNRRLRAPQSLVCVRGVEQHAAHCEIGHVPPDDLGREEHGRAHAEREVCVVLQQRVIREVRAVGHEALRVAELRDAEVASPRSRPSIASGGVRGSRRRGARNKSGASIWCTPMLVVVNSKRWAQSRNRERRGGAASTRCTPSSFVADSERWA